MSIGDFGGVPVYESPLLPPGTAYVVARGLMTEPLEFGPMRDLYSRPAGTVSGYIQRRANALRRDLGLPERDYAEDWQRNHVAFLAEARLQIPRYLWDPPPLFLAE